MPLLKQTGGWSVTNLSCWMTIRWDGLLGLNTSISLPGWVQNALQTIFPTTDPNGFQIELVQATVDFGLNEIPTANVQAAVGRLASDVKELAAIHFLVKRLKLFLNCSIWCEGTVTSSFGPADSWPENDDGSPKPFRIFDGNIIGTGFRKTSQGVEFNLAITHWLSDLNFSSSTSRSLANNPNQIANDAAQPIIPNAGARMGGLNNANASPVTQPGPLFSAQLLRTDVWGNQNTIAGAQAFAGILPAGLVAIGFGGIKQWLTELSLQDRINWRQIQFAICDQRVPSSASNKKNVEALAALQRIEPLSSGYIDGVPLKMDDRQGMDNVANMLSSALGKETAEVMASHTIWDKLITWGSDLQYAIVPQVEKAMIVPFNPGLRNVWTSVFANDYDFFERTDHIPRPLRGVGLFVGMSFAAGGISSLNNMPVYNVPGAYYEDKDRRNGLIVWKKAPLWLSEVVVPYLYQVAGQTAPTVSNALAIVNVGPPREKAPKCKFQDVASLWCDYARAMYIQEILRGRSGRLSGRIRFDIAPGSMIRVEEPEDPFVLQQLNDNVASYVWAQVIRVSCVLNAESQKAGTAMQLSFMRDSDENADGSYSCDRHPIWSCNWYGAPLVNDPAFYPGDLPLAPPPAQECKTVTLPRESCGGAGTLIVSNTDISTVNDLPNFT